MFFFEKNSSAPSFAKKNRFALSRWKKNNPALGKTIGPMSFTVLVEKKILLLKVKFHRIELTASSENGLLLDVYIEME